MNELCNVKEGECEEFENISVVLGKSGISNYILIKIWKSTLEADKIVWKQVFHLVHCLLNRKYYNI